jgi:hypothetical protein
MDANTGSGFSQLAGNQFKKASGARLLFLQPASPFIEIGRFNPGIPAIRGNAHAACRLGFYDGVPMGLPFFSRHLLPPNDEDFLLLESIAQKRTAEKTGSSEGYPESDVLTLQTEQHNDEEDEL